MSSGYSDEGRPHKSRRATPSQEERDRIAAEIRAEWDAATERKRRVTISRPVSTPKAGRAFRVSEDGGLRYEP